jgi:hypothetical protein
MESMTLPRCCNRLPACTTASQRMQVVAAAIDVLGLDDVRHQLIGNEEVGVLPPQESGCMCSSMCAHCG